MTITQAAVSEVVSATALAVLDVAQTAAQFAPVPGLALVLQAVASIIRTCDKITSNQSEIEFLRKRCNFLSDAINNNTHKINSTSADSLTEIFTETAVHLQTVQKLLNKHATGQQKWEAFFRQLQISKDIETCHRELDTCCEEFSIIMNLRFHQWHEEHSAAYKNDHEDLERAIKGLGDNYSEILRAVHATKEDVKTVSSLLQEFMNSIGAARHLGYRKMQLGLYKSNGILPSETDLTEEVDRVGGFAVATTSAIFDVWEGMWLKQEKVAMKTIRGIKMSPKALKRFQEEIKIWGIIANQAHGNYILPLYGYVHADHRLYMISPWMANGNVMGYIRRYPGCDRVKLIQGIAKGLEFLHGLRPPMVHGNVRGNSILVNSNGDPLIADFGLTKAVESIAGISLTQSQADDNSFRWYSPEMCTGSNILTPSDVFSFAMTIIEIMTMCKPFGDALNTIQAIEETRNGERPPRPENIDDQLWEICEGCWKHEPHDRLTMTDVLQKLENLN